MKKRVIAVLFILFITTIQANQEQIDQTQKRQADVDESAEIYAIVNALCGSLAIGAFSVALTFKDWALLNPHYTKYCFKAAKGCKGLGYLAMISFGSYVIGGLSCSIGRNCHNKNISNFGVIMAIPSLILTWVPTIIFVTYKNSEKENKI
jgi:hypothetical protein